MKIKWILICLLVAVGITGCKNNEEPTLQPIHYYDGLWVANSLGDTTANPDYLLVVEGENRLYATIDWNELSIYPCDDNTAEQYKNLSFTYCSPLFYDWSNNLSLGAMPAGLRDALKHWRDFINFGAWVIPSGFLINGIVNNNLDLYRKAQALEKLSNTMKKDLDDFASSLHLTYLQLENNLKILERSIKSVDSVRAVSLRQNRLAYFRKCNDDLVNEQQIVYSRAAAYFSTINELLNVSNLKTREDTLNFYRRIDPVVSEWAGEGGLYIDQVKNLMDKMVTTYSVSSLGQSTYDVGMPSLYRSLAEWTYPKDSVLKREELYKSLCLRDLDKMTFAFIITNLYCETKMNLYHSAEALVWFNEFVALKEKLLKYYPIKEQK